MRKILAIAACACKLYAENLPEQMYQKHTGLPVTVSLLLISILLLILLITVFYRKFLSNDRHKKMASEEQFETTCERLGMTATEKSKIRQLIRHENMMQPLVIIQSVSVFEKCMNTEVKRIVSLGIDKASIEAEDEILSSIRRKAGFQFLPHECPLISTRNIPLGQTGSIFGSNHRTPLINRVSVVQKNEFIFTLQYNSEKEDIIQITPELQLKFVFTRQSDGMYGIPLRVSDAKTGIIIIYHTMDIRRNQLRQFIRIELNLPIKLRSLKTTNHDINTGCDLQVMEARMSDICGGGLSFSCDKALKPGDFVSVSFSMPAGTFSEIVCKILRTSLMESKNGTFFKHHVQFVNMESRKRDMIVKYVHEKQSQINQWR